MTKKKIPRVPVQEFRNRLPHYLERLPVHITRRGRIIAIVRYPRSDIERISKLPGKIEKTKALLKRFRRLFRQPVQHKKRTKFDGSAFYNKYKAG